MTALFVEIPGDPVPQPRPRARVVEIPGKKPIAQIYNPERHPCAKWRERAALFMRTAMGRQRTPLFDCPLELEILCLFPRPKSTPKRQVDRVWHAKATGDVDNLVKPVLDAANGVVWRDDCLVSRVVVSKMVAAEGEQSCVKLWVRTLGEIPT